MRLEVAVKKVCVPRNLEFRLGSCTKEALADTEIAWRVGLQATLNPSKPFSTHLNPSPPTLNPFNPF